MKIRLYKKILPLSVAITVVFAFGTFAVPAFSVSRSDVSRTNASLDEIAAEYSAALSKLCRLESQMRQTQAKLDAAVVEQQRCQEVLNGRINSMYRHGNIGFIDVIFNAGSFQDFILRFELLKKIGQLDKEVLDKATQAKAEVERRKNQLASQKAEQKKVTGKLASAKNELARQLSQQQAALAKQEASARQQRERSRRQVAYQSSPSRSSGGYRVGGGFVFPVRGANGYSNSWGAPRSGGRGHKGTDIMAPHGTPVVACVSGTVSRGSGGSAGLYIYLHGDDGNTYFYAHLSGYGAGGHVSAGTVIGYVGSTGNASAGAPHLHFEVHPGGGGAVNPYSTLRGSG